jgi:hypothetical protein
MKVALCFSGKLGNWQDCYDSILQNIIAPLKPDIYFATWNTEDYQNFFKQYRPTKFMVHDESCIKTFDIFKHEVEPNPALLPMLINMKAVYKVIENQKTKYDLVIRLRPDIQVLEQIKIHEIQDCIKSKSIRLPFFESSNIYNHEEELKKEFAFSFVYDQASLPNQVNDQIAIGHPSEMKKYMSCLDNYVHAINLLWNEGYPEYMIKVNESVLTIALQLKNCKYKQLTGTNSFNNIKTKLIRQI